jgi:hypothetical protein
MPLLSCRHRGPRSGRPAPGEDVQEYWSPDASEDTPRAQWYVCHTQHEALLEDRHYAFGRHDTAGAAQEAVTHDENSRDVYLICLNELCTVADVAFHTDHTVRTHGWVEDTDWLTAFAAPAGLIHPHLSDDIESMCPWLSEVARTGQDATAYAPVAVALQLLGSAVGDRDGLE